MTLRRVLVIATAAFAAIAALSSSPGAAATAEPEAGTPDWRSVSAGQNHTCAIRLNGRLYCWGDDSVGELGNGATVVGDVLTPFEVRGGFTDWTSVSAGLAHTCGLRSNGRLYCWGLDTSGQVGNGAPLANRTGPTEVAGHRTDWVAVVAGGHSTCARRASGRLFCWGRGGAGQVGHSASPNPENPSPLQVAGNRTDWRAFGLANETTCATRASGRLFCWGSDVYGQLGDNATLASQPLPVQVRGGHTDWNGIRGGTSHVCARRAGGHAFCWGLNGFGQIGSSTAANPQPTPLEIANGALAGWGVPEGGDAHSCALRSGHLYCWGGDYAGQMGNGPGITNSPTPIEVTGNFSTWTSVAVGQVHTCAIKVSHRLYCWGSNTDGRTGLGTTSGNQEEPAEVEA